MNNSFASVVTGAILILGALFISVVVGIVVSMNSIDWWQYTVFSSGYGSDATTFLVLPIAFLVPFFGALLIQYVLWRSLIKKP